jgi:hypothetical protein
MASFDDILEHIHSGSSVTDSALEENYITINSKREFIVPKGADTVLGYAGDVNSQIVTFVLPNSHEGH